LGKGVSKVNKIRIRVIVLLVIGLIISACVLSPLQIKATDISINADLAEDHPTQPLTLTSTSTPSPTYTKTPEATPIPTETEDFLLKEKEFVAEVNALLDSGDISGAVDLCTKAIDLNPSFAEAYTLRGIILLSQENNEVALRDFDKAIELGITDELEKEISPGMSVKTIYYFRGYTSISIGAYEEGIKDLEHFLEITGPAEYPQLRAYAQYDIDNFHESPVPVSSSQRFDFPYYSIVSPIGDGWGAAPTGPMSIRFARVDKLDSGDTVYSELSTIGVSYVDISNVEDSDNEFTEYACEIMEKLNVGEGDRITPIETSCNRCSTLPSDCVCYQASVEDHGGVERPYSPPLIIEGQTLTCRHPDFNEVMIILQYTQRGPSGSLDDDILKQSEEFFKGLSFNKP